MAMRAQYVVGTPPGRMAAPWQGTSGKKTKTIVGDHVDDLGPVTVRLWNLANG